MTSGPMGDNEGLLSEEEEAALLQLSPTGGAPAATGRIRAAAYDDRSADLIPAGRRVRLVLERAGAAPRQTTASSPGRSPGADSSRDCGLQGSDGWTCPGG